MKRYRVILDTNVIVAALRSRTGASYRLLMTLGHPRWQGVVTPALMYEYEDAARRPGNAPGLSGQEITDILDTIYRESHRQLVWFSWRPAASDPGDDLVIDAAIAGGVRLCGIVQRAAPAGCGRVRHRSSDARGAAQTDR